MASRDTVPDDLSTPCEATFTRLALYEPTRLRDWILHGVLKDVDLSFALEAFGFVRNRTMAVALLTPFLRHEKCYVREGALLGLSRHLGPDLRDPLLEVAQRDILDAICEHARELVDLIDSKR